VNISDDQGEAKAFIRKYGWTWPSLVDPDVELAGSLGLYGHPAIAVLDERGVIAARLIGGGDVETWEALAADL
jgi:cytochrome c biogenesis protein CcmG/thiol:disulfide interchange protein DsbE